MSVIGLVYVRGGYPKGEKDGDDVETINSGRDDDYSGGMFSVMDGEKDYLGSTTLLIYGAPI
jgi:hypothetical protein